MYAVPQLAEILDEAMGVIFQAKGHPTVYLVGDTIWTAEVNKTINRYKPDVMIMNTGDARTLAFPMMALLWGYKMLLMLVKCYRIQNLSRCTWMR